MVNRDHYKDENAHIGEKIKLRRRQQKLSQTKLAEAVHMTFQQIQKYEHGSNRVGAALLYAISEALDVPIGYFFDGIDNGKNLLPVEVKATPAECKVAFENLPDDLRTHIYAVMSALSK